MKAIFSIQQRCRRGRRQAGFSLVELMVALTIGLIVVFGLTAMFINMRSTFRSQDSLAQLQDNERLAMSILTAAVQQAGYYPASPTDTREDLLPQDTAIGTSFGIMAAGQYIVGTAPGTNGAPPETFSTRYAAKAGEDKLNCVGMNAGAGRVRNVFWVDAVSKTLGCAVSVNGVFASQTATPLISGVESMRVLYGVDTDSDGNIDAYRTAAALNGAAALWSNVKAAQITLEFTNPFAAQAGQAARIGWVQTINLMNNK